MFPNRPPKRHKPGKTPGLDRGLDLDREEIERMHGEHRSAARDMIDYMHSDEARPPTHPLLTRLRGGP